MGLERGASVNAPMNLAAVPKNRELQLAGGVLKDPAAPMSGISATFQQGYGECARRTLSKAPMTHQLAYTSLGPEIRLRKRDLLRSYVGESEEPQPKVRASSKEKARVNWGHMLHNPGQCENWHWLRPFIPVHSTGPYDFFTQKGDGSSPSHLGERGILKIFSTVGSRLDFRALSERMIYLNSSTALSIFSLKTI